MKPLFRNIFMLFGIAAIVVMLCTFDTTNINLDTDLPRVVSYLPAVIGVWIFVYAFNAKAFQLIVNTGAADRRLPFRHAYKLTVSGFAFSYITPFGFGGGPYRVMELSAHIGTTRAMSSVVLYSMMHIFSHICLWASSVVLFIIFYAEKADSFLWTAFGIFAAVLVFVVYFFYEGYRNGLIVKLYRLLFYIPLAGKYARRFYSRHAGSMEQIDRNIAYMHRQRRAFCLALLCEYLARLVNAFEFYFIFLAFGTPVTPVDAVLVLSFSSLMGNLLFFLPMQMGAREGGLAIVVRILAGGINPVVGVFAGLFTRVRELVWIFIGVGLVKIGNKRLFRECPTAEAVRSEREKGLPAEADVHGNAGIAHGRSGMVHGKSCKAHEISHKAHGNSDKVHGKFDKVEAVIFDYGGTLDTDARHWAGVLREGYAAAGIDVPEPAFREAYVYGERALAKSPIVQPGDNFRAVLLKKVEQEIRYLVDGCHWTPAPAARQAAVAAVADYCYGYVVRHLAEVRPVLDRMAARYRLVLVSNFYGNIHAVLRDFQLDAYFDAVVESAVVGVRKPDPAIYRLGVEAAGTAAERIVVVGDSYTKDIVPAKSVGCRAVWLKGESWTEERHDESLPDAVISRIGELPDLL